VSVTTRLNPKEVARIDALADRQEIPLSTMLRSPVRTGLAAHRDREVDGSSTEMQAMLIEGLRATGGPLTDEERAWADAVFPMPALRGQPVCGPGRRGGDGVLAGNPVIPIGDTEVAVEVEVRGGRHLRPAFAPSRRSKTATLGRPSFRRGKMPH
jgi:hypothetical protein